jgi:hypothetical protein
MDSVCVNVLAGQVASTRNSHQSPDQPSQATPSELTEAANATAIGLALGEPPVHHVSPWTCVGMGALVAVPAIAIPIATRSGLNPGIVALPGNGCPTTNPKC